MLAEIDPQQLAQAWRARSFSCDLWVDPPGQCWENFVHDTDELVMVLQGEMEFEMAGQACHPQPGEALFIPAGVCHSARNRGNRTARWLYGYRQGS